MKFRFGSRLQSDQIIDDLITFNTEVITMNDLVNIISTIGFPIFSFLLCGYALKYVYDKERKSLDEAIKKLGDLTLAVEHNSEAIRDLTDRMKGE